MNKLEIGAKIAQLQPIAQKGLEIIYVRPGSRMHMIGLGVACVVFIALGISALLTQLLKMTMAAAFLVGLASFAGALS